MASLNTLRTKFGVALSVVIALALLAFIFSLRTEMGFSDNDPKVGVINGDKISYSEYINEYETVKANNGGSEASDEQPTLWPTPLGRHWWPSTCLSRDSRIWVSRSLTPSAWP